MIFLEGASLIIRDTLEKKLYAEKFESCNVSGGDFDGTSFRIKSSGDKKEILIVSLGVNCGEVLNKYGMQDVLKKVFGDFVVEPEKDFTATLQIKLEGLDNDKKTFLLNEVPLLKRYVMMSPFVHAFDKTLKGEKFDTIRIPYRDEESIYIICYEGKSLVVLYSIKFRDADDIVLAKVFLQEFKDARRDRQLNNAPAVNFSQGSKPLELKGIQSGEPDDPESLKSFGFVSLVMFNRHIEEKNRSATMDKLLSFRNYLHYHLKCSKAYMHFRMRDRYSLLLQSLEAAKDKTGKKKELKTITGRRFEKKA